MADHAAITFDHVRFVVPPGKVLLDDITLAVMPGETLVLLGRSGCGKTTTMRMINRMLEPTSGEVRVEGRTTMAWDPIRLRRRIGYVLQEAGLFPHETVAENVALVPSLEQWPAARVRDRVTELLGLVGLPPEQFAGRYPRELSGGQRQRVGIARALAADPPIMLMDEPFSALDPITRRDLALEVRALQRRLGKTIVFVTHDIREAFAIATRIGLMHEGRLIYLGAPAGLASCEHPEAKAFLASLEDPTPAGEGHLP